MIRSFESILTNILCMFYVPISISDCAESEIIKKAYEWFGVKIVYNETITEVNCRVIMVKKYLLITNL